MQEKNLKCDNLIFMFIVRNFVAVVFNCLPPRSTPNILPPLVMSPIYICDVTFFHL